MVEVWNSLFLEIVNTHAPIKTHRVSSDSNFGIKVNDKLITNEKDVADVFNDFFFINVPSKLKEPLIPSNLETLKTYVNSKIPSDTSFNIPLTNFSFVTIYLSSLDGSKATGLDCTGPKLLKIAPSILSPS